MPFPKLATFAQPDFDAQDSFAGNPAFADPAAFFRYNQSTCLQHLNVLMDRGKGCVVGLGQVTYGGRSA